MFNLYDPIPTLEYGLLKRDIRDMRAEMKNHVPKSKKKAEQKKCKSCKFFKNGCGNDMAAPYTIACSRYVSRRKK